MSYPLYATVTGNVGNPGGGVISSINVFAVTATFRQGGSGGTIFLDMGSPASTSVQTYFDKMNYQGQLHVTITGTGSVTVEVD
jgi:hypothetical protein